MSKAEPAPSIQPVATSLASFLKVAQQIADEWSDDQGEARPWFRGHGRSSWQLLPSIYRHPFQELNEDSCRLDFQRMAYPYLPGVAREPTTEWDWYFIMQHHGLPTRLLDWSESPLVALYFALRDTIADTAATVWLLDPWALNKRLGGFDFEILLPTEQKIQPYLCAPFTVGAGSVPAHPIALYASHNSRRLAAQRGVFTLHGEARVPLEDYSSLLGRSLVKIEIPPKSIPVVRQDLAFARITETTVFPDLPSLCRELLEYWLP